MPASFLDSSLRRLIFPYLEGADNEDPCRPAHWMSNITAEALGLDSPSSSSSLSSSSSSASSSLSSSSASCSGRSSRDALNRRFAGAHLNRITRTHSPHHNRFSSSTHHETATSSPLSCNDIDELRAVPWASIYVQQCNSPVPASSDEEDEEDDEQLATLRADTAFSTSQGRCHGQRTTHNHDASREREVRNRALTAPQATATSTPTSAAIPQTSSKCNIRRRRRLRGTSAPTPLTPAQPLDQVNTSLPLQIPPPKICLQGPAEGLVKPAIEPARESQPLTALSPVSSSSSLVHSIESDGSFYGDAGDDDPESQLAAGIARLKAKRRQEEADRTPKPSSHHQQLRHPVDNTITTVKTEDASDNDTDGSSDSASRFISENASFMTSLADIVLEFQIRRSGPFRGRAASTIDVPAFGPDQVSPHGLARSQSLDALVEAELSRRMGGRPRLTQEMVSTPDSLRNEVQRWSQGRNWRSTASSRFGSPLSSPRSESPAPAVARQPESRGLLGGLSIVHSLLSRSATYRHFASIAEGLAGEEDEDENHPSSDVYANSIDVDVINGEEQDRNDDGDDECDLDGLDSTAYSSLWATPVPSRSNSSYNLEILSEERSAFQEAGELDSSQGTYLRPSTYERKSFPYSHQGQSSQRHGCGARGVKRHSPSSPMASEQEGKISRQGVSPLWDVNPSLTGEEQKENAAGPSVNGNASETTESAAQRPCQPSSWTSLLGGIST